MTAQERRETLVAQLVLVLLGVLTVLAMWQESTRPVRQSPPLTAAERQRQAEEAAGAYYLLQAQPKVLGLP